MVSCHSAKVLKSTYSIQPASRKTFSNAMEQMVFELNLQPGEEKVIGLEWEVLLSEINVLETPAKQVLPEEDRALYLRSGSLYECDARKL